MTLEILPNNALGSSDKAKFFSLRLPKKFLIHFHSSGLALRKPEAKEIGNIFHCADSNIKL